MKLALAGNPNCGKTTLFNCINEDIKTDGGAMDPCCFAQHFFSLKARNSLISPRTTSSALRQ